MMGTHGRNLGSVIALLALSFQLQICPAAIGQGAPGTPAAPSAPSDPSAPSNTPSIVNASNGSTTYSGTHVIDFGLQPGGLLNLTGDLTNLGIIYAISTNPTITSAIFSAPNISNQSGAIITSVLPTGGLAGYSNAISGLNLTFNTSNNFFNAGLISSAGSLAINAGGTITNALPTGIAGPMPVMQAIGNIDIASQIGSIINAGTIASAAANINISAAASNALLVNNTGGILQALNGTINVRDSLFGGNLATTLTGGDVLSKTLDIFGGTGMVNAHTNSISGILNVIADGAQIGVKHGDLNFGTLKLDGDPTFYSADGSINILNFNVATTGADIAIIAAGDITGGDWVIDTQNTNPLINNGNAGSVLMVAGASFISPTTGTELPEPTGTLPVIFTSPNPLVDTGGSITMNTLSINSTGKNTGNNAGSVTLIAYQGTAADSGVIAPVTSSSIDASTPTGFNGIPGNVLLIAGGGAIGTNAINFGNINSSGGTIEIFAAAPQITGNSNSITVVDGTIQLGSGTFTPAPLNAADVVVGNLTSNGISTGALPFGAGTAGGAINIGSLSAVTTADISAIGGNGVSGAFGTAEDGSRGGAGGSLTIRGTDVTTGNVSLMGGKGGDGGGGGGSSFGGGGDAGGAGGTINISATNLSTGGGAGIVYNASGGDGGAGGEGDDFGGNANVFRFGVFTGGGGNGGTINISSLNTDIGDLRVDGGQGGAGGLGNVNANGQGGAGSSGGNAGNITVTSKSQLWTFELSAKGGAGGQGGDGSLVNGTSGANNFSTINGTGGNGGTIVLNGDDVLLGLVGLNGGDGGAGGLGGNTGGNGFAGGNAGTFTVNAGVALDSDDITAIGGKGGNGGQASNIGVNGNGANGGTGGILTLSGQACCLRNIDVSGGNGGDAGTGGFFGNGGNGAKAGSISLQSSTDIQTDNLFANGGKGGVVGCGACGVAGIGASGGTITANSSAGGVFVFADVSATGYGAVSGVPNQGGTISLSSGDPLTGVAVGGGVSARGEDGANGGQITINAPDVAIGFFGGFAPGLDVSSDTATGGTINVTTTSLIDPLSNNLCGCSNNFIGGGIVANGANGGRINLNAAGGFSFDSSSVISANGSTGNGGLIQFTQPGSAVLSMENDGMISATNNAGNSGRIGFNAGETGTVVVTNPSTGGELIAGEFVGFGNIDPVTLDVINFRILDPLAPVFVAYPANVSQLNIANQVRVGTGPRPTTATVTTSASSKGNSLAQIVVQIPQVGSNSTISNLDSTPIFVTLNGHYPNGPKPPSTFLDGLTIANATDIGSGDGINLLPGGDNGVVLNRGNLLVRPVAGGNAGLQIQTKEGIVSVAPGALAFVMETGNDVAVYALHEGQLGDITFKTGDQKIVISTGQQVVLTRDMKADFAAVNPGAMIPARSIETYSFDNGVKAFVADYSMSVALTVIRPLKNMRNSESPEIRRASGAVEKTPQSSA